MNIPDSIAQLSIDELKELCNTSSDERYLEIVNQSDKVKGLEAEREILMASVRSLAEFNISRQEDYERDRSQLLNLVGDCQKLREDIQQKAAKLLELSRSTSLASTLAVVRAAAIQAEEESEVVARSFLNESTQYDSFINQFCEKRKLANSRRIKADRLHQETDESWTGHTGIADSNGIIYDFGGSHYIAVDNMTFGSPTKVLRLDPTKAQGLAWDDAIQVSATRYRERRHNIFTNNCHDHVADTLNEMKYNGRNDYTRYSVLSMIMRGSE